MFEECQKTIVSKPKKTENACCVSCGQNQGCRSSCFTNYFSFHLNSNTQMPKSILEKAKNANSLLTVKPS